MQKKIILYIAIFLAAFSILPVLAPLFAHFGWEAAADGLYWTYQWFCHQRPWRSYHLYDYQYAMDARMMLMFLSMSIGGFYIYFKRLQPLQIKTSLLVGALAILPLGVDGTTQLIAEILSQNDARLPFYESTNLIRSVTGTLFGTGMAFALFPHLIQTGTKYSRLKDFLSSMLISTFISLLFIPLMVFLWGITSNKYTPSSILIDHKQRYPGYNYEITTGAEHSTIRRSIRVNETDLYIRRAIKYDRTDILDDYESTN